MIHVQFRKQSRYWFVLCALFGGTILCALITLDLSASAAVPETSSSESTDSLIMDLEDPLVVQEDVIAEEYIREVAVSIFKYGLPVSLACILSAILFAWAYVTGSSSSGANDVAAEALRKQRWRIAQLSLTGVVGLAIPFALLFLVATALPYWVWILFGSMYLPLLWGVWRYGKIVRLSKHT